MNGPFVDFVDDCGIEQAARVAYRMWNPGGNKTLFCVHGLSRNAKDFDPVGRHLAPRGWRTVAIDLPGRGASGWLDDKTAYTVPLYEQVCRALLKHLGITRTAWLGTSLGGILGSFIASSDDNPITRLAINDIGPHVPVEGMRDNLRGFGADPFFTSFEEALRVTKETRYAFGPMPEAEWRTFTVNSLRPLPEGGYRLHYDPGLKVNQAEPTAPLEFWEAWDRIAIPVLEIWGTESKILPRAVVDEMRGRGPGCAVHAVFGTGHCPTLTDAASLAALTAFLEG